MVFTEQKQLLIKTNTLKKIKVDNGTQEYTVFFYVIILGESKTFRYLRISEVD